LFEILQVNRNKHALLKNGNAACKLPHIVRVHHCGAAFQLLFTYFFKFMMFNSILEARSAARSDRAPARANKAGS